ncbi:MAG TPA: ferrochelatase [Pirellulales bacterium]|jgi:ferrochelatase|nr:ferrochelatase [Pirellulales bacterium]
MSTHKYDALLVVSFGGPEGMADVAPFLENVLRGKNVPRERMLEVAEHYRRFGGVSPLNAQNRALIAALRDELDSHGPRLPIYWGNRNWHPLLPDTLGQMAADGVRRALAFFTSAYSSYSGCRQYLENIEQARAEVGPAAPRIDKLRTFFNHPGFIEPMIDRTREAIERIPTERSAGVRLAFTAHSIPLAMAQGCRYEPQLREACRLVAETVGREWELVYQSRSGPPSQPWLEPDIRDWLRSSKSQSENRLRRGGQSPLVPDHLAMVPAPQKGTVPGGSRLGSKMAGASDVVIVPIGFISDHVEVIYDLDMEAHAICDELGINMVRAATVGTHPRFVQMIRELIVERIDGNVERPALGTLGPSHDFCPDDCCPSGRPATRPV